ncbi:polyprenyl synthetase family protein [Paenibacillus sp. FJAT-27812]|uniref:polyprenyl synthetase family protein n=1 Tax=Paenibacillus sp. FJAT-27812 TaxID=1684143 RepID=UPI0006A7E84D|nr:polyprenyl synthetase family protein [Paenibacillus sp. FJAT-27812]
MQESAPAGSYEQRSMLDYVSIELFKIIDKHFYEESYNRIIRSYIQYKKSETTLWSELTLYTHYMLGGSSPAIYHAAAQTELLILSLDIFDDLQDQDNFIPPWMHDEPSVAMNCASGIMAAAIAGYLNKPLGSDILQLLTTAHNGQHKDIQNTVTKEEEYLQLISEKSASLLGAAIKLGYQLVDQPDASIAIKLADFAQFIGIAAQLRNDVKNLSILQERNDIVQRKRTLATLYLLDHSEGNFPFLRKYYDGIIGMEELPAHEQQLVEFIHTSGVSEYTSAVQKLYLLQADHLLTTIPVSQPWEHHFRAITIGHFRK